MDDEGNLIEVFSLLNPCLNLFLGTSEYNSYVRESGLVSNNTYEIFAGASVTVHALLACSAILWTKRKIYITEVEYYTFSNIKMKNTVPQNIR